MGVMPGEDFDFDDAHAEPSDYLPGLDPKPSKKGLKKRERLQRTPFTSLPAVGDEIHIQLNPLKLDEVLEDELGKNSVGKAVKHDIVDVGALAYDIINEHNLHASLAQWGVIQEMIEQGIRAGITAAGRTR
jgi:hypothetical protein